MTDKIKIEYQDLLGKKRKTEYAPIPGSSHWTKRMFKKVDEEWESTGSAEVKYVQISHE